MLISNLMIKNCGNFVIAMNNNNCGSLISIFSILKWEFMVINEGIYIPFTLRNKKAVEDFPILHGYFQSRIELRKIHTLD